MADSLCGPSNPMENLQKQAAKDRSLQQDRLTSRPTLAQGFRSSGPSTGILDPEFESFQGGQAHFPGPEPHSFNQAAFLASQRVHQNGQMLEPGNWIGEFAQMSLSSPSASLVRPQALAQHPRWQAEFAEKQTQSSQLPDQGQTQFKPRFQGLGGLSVWSPRYTLPPGFQINRAQQDQGQGQASDTFYDDEAFARAFEVAEAEAEMRPSADWELELDQAVRDFEREKEEKAQDERAHAELDRLEIEAAEKENQISSAEEEAITSRIGADLIINPITDVPAEQRPLRDPDEDNEAMARTAASMLESVADNLSPKFRDSQFLKLMQQFRDRQVMVQGDKIVETNVVENGELAGREVEVASA